MAILFAFLHHLSAFVLVSALVIETVLIRDTLTHTNARRILIADAVYGASATVLLIVGLLRVFQFEKGEAYYFSSPPFIVKISLFALLAVLSFYPTFLFLSWRKGLKQGQTPVLTVRIQQRIRGLIHLELVGVVIILLCAAAMAKGFLYD